MSPPSWTPLPLLPSPVPSHPSRLSQSTGLSSPCHPANFHLLSVLHMVMYAFPCWSLSSSRPHLPHWVHRPVLSVHISTALQIASLRLRHQPLLPSLLGILKDTPGSEDNMIWTSIEICLSLWDKRKESTVWFYFVLPCMAIYIYIYFFFLIGENLGTIKVKWLVYY